MPKKCAILFIFLLLLPLVNAGLTKIDVPLSVNFVNEREFNLIWENNILKNYRWDNGTTRGNETFNISIYKDLNDTFVCQTQSNSFQNLTEKMIDVVDTCKQMVDGNNISILYEIGDLKYSQGLQTEKLNNCQNDLSKYSEKASQLDVCKRSEENWKGKYDSCVIENEGLRGNNSWLISALIGIGIGWVIWGRKKGNNPSEYNEAGYSEG